MKVYFIFRNHFKTIRAIHLGFDISCCFEAFAMVISISLLFMTIGIAIHKKLDI